MTTRLWIGTTTTQVTHFAGSRKLSAVLRIARRSTKKLRSHYGWLTSQQTKKEKRTEYDERWYVLFCNRVHLGVRDKVSTFDVSLWLHSVFFCIVVRKLLCHWRIRELQGRIKRLEHGLLGRWR